MLGEPKRIQFAHLRRRCCRNILLISQGSNPKELGRAVVSSFLPSPPPRILPPQQSLLRPRLLYNPHLVSSYPLHFFTKSLFLMTLENDALPCFKALTQSHRQSKCVRCEVIIKELQQCEEECVIITRQAKMPIKYGPQPLKLPPQIPIKLGAKNCPSQTKPVRNMVRVHKYYVRVIVHI